MSATPNLEQALANDDKILAADMEKEEKLREFENEPCGPVHDDMLAFARASGYTFTPTALRDTLGRRYPMFTSGAQEEAHEALGNILNCLPGLKSMMKHTMRVTDTVDQAEVLSRTHSDDKLMANRKVKHDTNYMFKIPLQEPTVGQPQKRLDLQTLFEATAEVTERMAQDNQVAFELMNVKTVRRRA